MTDQEPKVAGFSIESLRRDVAFEQGYMDREKVAYDRSRAEHAEWLQSERQKLSDNPEYMADLAEAMRREDQLRASGERVGRVTELFHQANDALAKAEAEAPPETTVTPAVPEIAGVTIPEGAIFDSREITGVEVPPPDAPKFHTVATPALEAETPVADVSLAGDPPVPASVQDLRDFLEIEKGLLAEASKDDAAANREYRAWMLEETEKANADPEYAADEIEMIQQQRKMNAATQAVSVARAAFQKGQAAVAKAEAALDQE